MSVFCLIFENMDEIKEKEAFLYECFRFFWF